MYSPRNPSDSESSSLSPTSFFYRSGCTGHILAKASREVSCRLAAVTQIIMRDSWGLAPDQATSAGVDPVLQGALGVASVFERALSVGAGSTAMLTASANESAPSVSSHRPVADPAAPEASGDGTRAVCGRRGVEDQDDSWGEGAASRAGERRGPQRAARNCPLPFGRR